MHPAMDKFIEEFEAQALRSGQYRKTLGKNERIFLQNVWGPAFQYNFNGLKPEYPFKDFKGGDRFVDFVYTAGGIRLIIEIDAFTTHARDISPGEFDDHLSRQNDLLLSGWFILRFSANQVEKRKHVCQRQILQAIGHWWTITHNQFSGAETQVWELRKRLIIQLALSQGGCVKTQDVANKFNISMRSALNWLKRFSSPDNLILTPIMGKEKIIGYNLLGILQGNG
jgi:very-short-patch-repair endonuclease